MIYETFQELKLSALGMGCMRLPQGDAYADINVPEVKRMVALAMEKGVNYYDTAWGYHDGNSERVMGEVLSAYPRENFYLATKFPGYDLSNMGKVKEIFEEQLERCRVDYFDFYLFHNVCEMNIEQYLDPKYGIFRVSDGTEEKWNASVIWDFRSWQSGNHAAFSGCVWEGHGILPDSAELAGL